MKEEKVNAEFNVIPIGIFDLKGADENEIRFVDASVLQENLYQATATFKIGGRLFVSNSSDATGLEIDFGSGFQRYDLNEHQITHTFTATGRQVLKIKVLTNRAVYVFHTAVHVLQLQRRAAYRNYQISAPPVISDTTVYHVGNARIAATVPGANVRIVLGCDQVFDKPLLIIEGIDLGENRYLDVLEAEYLTVQSSLHAFAAQGFDIVFVDWQNSRDYIQNNAQVLKAVINDVNQSKIGNSPLIVVGESMGGLVGRWALREMENEGVAHQVSHFICYDTPHQGANIPVGLTQIYWETPLDHFESHLVNFLPRFVFHYYQSLNTPAARQLLIHWGGRTNVGVGNAHPDYFTFRSELTAKGNLGYPAFCQNVALIEGSITASDRSLFDQFNYGDRILLGWLPGVRRNSHLDVHTNALSDNKSVTRLFINQIPPKFPTFLFEDIKYDSPFNDDFLPGGKSTVSVRMLKFLATKTFDFCFIPTFSAIDYSGSVTTQSARELLDITQILPAQTPFAAIYGHADDLNEFHVRPRLAPWQAMGLAEGILTNNFACPAAPTPPPPNIYFDQSYCFPFSATRVDQPFPVTVHVEAAGQDYRQVLLIEKLSSQDIQEGYLMDDQADFTFQVYTAGQYKVTCERSFPGRPDLTSSASATVNVSNCPDVVAIIGDNNAFNPIDCQGFWEGDYLLTFENDTTKHAFVHKEGSILYATLEKDDAFVPRSVLIANHLFEEFALCFAEADPRPLPVRLIEFSVEAFEDIVQLRWKTANEVNSAYFEIQKSVDGESWQTVDTLRSGNAGEKNWQYAFEDTVNEGQTVYYRLKMVDLDGTFAYSRIAKAHFDQAKPVVYPNPVADIAKWVDDAHIREVTLYDLSGKVLFRDSGPVRQINLSSLLQGRYILQLTTDDGSAHRHLIIKR